MIKTKAVVETVTMPAWSVHLKPVDHRRPWRLDAVSAATYPSADRPERAAVHLTDGEVAALAETLLRPRHFEEPQPGRARVVRDGFGLLLRLVVDPVDEEPGVIVHVQEHHRLELLDDLGRYRPDLIPTTAPPEPRMYLGSVPVTGLTLDQVVELHDRLGRWLDSEGIRAAFADRDIARQVSVGTVGPLIGTRKRIVGK
ncbi:hypothetical protein [Embleya sp. AB8]|uniref:hypothetical protein n=1 Tax=Embleya sp. AB8 TaxID=3156304 RepID=UPI003C76A30E